MRIVIYLTLLLFTTNALAQGVVNGQSALNDVRTTEFTINGSSKIEHCVFSESLTVNGSAEISHSKMKVGLVNGSLHAHGIDAKTLRVSGSATIEAKSDVADITVSGSLVIHDSYVDVATANGLVSGDGAYIKRITVNDSDLNFINSDLGKVFIYNTKSKKEVVIRLSGKTTVRHLTIDSPATIIVLDDVSKKLFDKSVVISNGKVIYR